MSTHEEVNYWDLIAENTRLAERLLACLESPTNPGPELAHGYIALANIPAHGHSAYGISIEMATTQDGRAIRYVLRSYDGMLVGRGMWNISLDTP
jgi:hypothetical protein